MRASEANTLVARRAISSRFTPKARRRPSCRPTGPLELREGSLFLSKSRSRRNVSRAAAPYVVSRGAPGWRTCATRRNNSAVEPAPRAVIRREIVSNGPAGSGGEDGPPRTEYYGSNPMSQWARCIERMNPKEVMPLTPCGGSGRNRRISGRKSRRPAASGPYSTRRARMHAA